MPRRCSSLRGGLGRGVGALLALALPLGCVSLSVGEERRLGYQFAHQMQYELPLVRDRVIVAYVEEMGFDLVAAAGPQPFEYHFYVVADDEINAFAGPAGHIYVNTETLLKAANASELAGVIAHEVGHVARRHVAENYDRQRNTRFGQNLLVAGAGLLGGGAAAGAAQLGGGLAGLAYLNSFGRQAEEEADEFAVDVLLRAGWDPDGLVTFFETLQREQAGRAPPFLSSHPPTAERIQATRAGIAAREADASLRRDDGGRFEIIQRRIRLLTQGPGSGALAPEAP